MRFNYGQEIAIKLKMHKKSFLDVLVRKHLLHKSAVCLYTYSFEQ